MTNSFLFNIEFFRILIEVYLADDFELMQHLLYLFRHAGITLKDLIYRLQRLWFVVIPFI